MADLHTLDRLEDIPEPVPDGDFVVVDVMISSTTVVRLLERGAAHVRPFADADAAREWGAETDDALLVGEQGGQPVEGFDSGPLPTALAGLDVADRPVGLLTSNGTRAVDRIGRDRDVFVGTTVNAAAVADALAERDRDAWVVAAGRAGERTPEDCAGADLVAGHYRGTLDEGERERLRGQVAESGTAGWFRDIGFGGEVEALLEFDSSPVVPRLRDGVFVDG